MIKRLKYLKWFIDARNNGFIKVITGVRRSGKSCILTSYSDYLLETGIQKTQILYYNFEHPDNFQLKDAKTLYEDIKERVRDTSETVYFLFDEIQEVEGWQKLVNGLRVAYTCDITITGSNANLLSGELATYLAGRYIELHVYPLSFSEFKQFHDELNREHHLDQLFMEYLKWGGFPALPEIDKDTIRKNILDGILSSILYKDVAARGDIKDTAILNRLISYLLDTIGSPISIKRASDVLNSEGAHTNPTTIDRYIGLLEDSFTFYKAYRYDIRGKNRLKTLGKYYTVDTGLRNNTLGRMGNLGSQIENIVYIELLRRGYEVFVGKLDQHEVDFVCFKGNEIAYYQVTYQLPEGSDREERNLLNISDNYPKTILTYNRMDVGAIDGIPIKHVVDWLLEE